MDLARVATLFEHFAGGDERQRRVRLIPPNIEGSGNGFLLIVYFGDQELEIQLNADGTWEAMYSDDRTRLAVYEHFEPSIPQRQRKEG